MKISPSETRWWFGLLFDGETWTLPWGRLSLLTPTTGHVAAVNKDPVLCPAVLFHQVCPCNGNASPRQKLQPQNVTTGSEESWVLGNSTGVITPSPTSGRSPACWGQGRLWQESH